MKRLWKTYELPENHQNTIFATEEYKQSAIVCLYTLKTKLKSDGQSLSGDIIWVYPKNLDMFQCVCCYTTRRKHFSRICLFPLCCRSFEHFLFSKNKKLIASKKERTFSWGMPNFKTLWRNFFGKITKMEDKLNFKKIWGKKNTFFFLWPSQTLWRS